MHTGTLHMHRWSSQSHQHYSSDDVQILMHACVDLHEVTFLTTLILIVAV